MVLNRPFVDYILSKFSILSILDINILTMITMFFHHKNCVIITIFMEDLFLLSNYFIGINNLKK